MVSKLASFAVVVLFINVVCAIIRCSDPSSSVGSWVIGVDRKECVALVKEKCDGMRSYFKWKRGIHVRSNCAKIPKWTAIATFLGSGGSYGGHAAIFESCAANGIWVYEQMNTSPVARRLRPYNINHAPSNGNNYYTVER